MPPRIFLHLKVYVFRLIARVFAYLDNSRAQPIAPKRSFISSFTTTSRPRSGNVKLLFYTPPNYIQNSPTKHPVVINFHGGGYTIGLASDDARWASVVTSSLNAVFVSVEYGLAPEHPYPAAIGDGVDAIRFLWAHADKFSLDVNNTIVSGFSAGGTLSLATVLKLHEEKRQSGHEHSNGDANKVRTGHISGIVAFYPGLDYTRTRAERTASNPISGPRSPIPPFLYELFDNSYLGPLGQRPDQSSPYLSPGRADTDLLKQGLPERIALYSCEWDQLLMETQDFRERLRGLGKVLGGYLVPEVVHGFDKRPSESEKRDKMYQHAIKEMRCMLGR